MLKKNEYYIAYSKNGDDRFRASSGGIGTAVTKFLLSNEEFCTSITFVFDVDLCMYVPKLIYSENEINICGSVYQDIDLIRFIRENIEKIKGGIVLTCAPCQVTPIRSLLNRRNIKNFIISYSCSGQTSIDGTWCYYRFLKINKRDVTNIQYRGNGWPSGIQISLRDGRVIRKDNWTEPWITIHQSNLFKPKRCLFCKLDSGKHSDMNLADPWLNEYITEEHLGATLCTICSHVGKVVFEKMCSLKKIESVPSSYNDYSIAEKPNVQKEINLYAEKDYKSKVAKIVGNRLYRNLVMKSFTIMKFHVQFLGLVRFFTMKRNFMNKFNKLIGKICTKLRVSFYKRKIGGYDSNFYMEKGIEMLNPQCIYFGKNVGVGAGTFFGPVINYAGVTYNPKILVGEGTWIGKHCSIAAINKVEIGKNVLFAGHVHITDHSHGYEDISMDVRSQPLTCKGPVIIEDDCWLGFSCEILSGVHIGKHCVVAARSVVTKDIPDYCIVAGNPAKVIKKYNEKTHEWMRV